MCFNSSSASSKESNVYDNRIGADNGGTAFKADGTNSITVGSDETAQFAIEGVTNTLTATTDLIGDAFTQLINSTDKSAQRATDNIKAQQDQLSGLLASEAQSADDRLLKLVKFAGFAAVAVVAINSGFLKDTVKAFR